MEIKEPIGKSGEVDLSTDESLNVSLDGKATISSGVLAGCTVELKLTAPIEKILDAAAAATKNGTVLVVEGYVKQLLEGYIKAKDAAAAVVAP